MRWPDLLPLLGGRLTKCGYRIKNPLTEVPKDQLLEDVRNFAHQHGLQDIIPLLEKGALVAQNPRDFESLPELDEDDRICLREEVTHRWKLPWGLYYTIFLNSIAAAIQGWDQTGQCSSLVSLDNDSSSYAANMVNRIKWSKSFVSYRVWYS